LFKHPFPGFLTILSFNGKNVFLVDSPHAKKKQGIAKIRPPLHKVMSVLRNKINNKNQNDSR